MRKVIIFSLLPFSQNASSTDFNQVTSTTTWPDHSTNNIDIELGTKAGFHLKRFRLGRIAAINRTHHDPRPSNKQGDRLYGDGFSIGITTESKNSFSFLYRHVTFRKNATKRNKT